eukprot:SAG11_NODE_279_length_11283_cov_11.461820_8_plen_41_part_00
MDKKLAAVMDKSHQFDDPQHHYVRQGPLRGPTKCAYYTSP